jgi:hypothetical protein
MLAFMPCSSLISLFCAALRCPVAWWWDFDIS